MGKINVIANITKNTSNKFKMNVTFTNLDLIKFCQHKLHHSRFSQRLLMKITSQNGVLSKEYPIAKCYPLGDTYSKIEPVNIDHG